MKNMEAQASEPLSKNTESTADHDSTEITSLWKLAPVTVALCTTLFCVSLVYDLTLLDGLWLIYYSGRYNHCDGYSQDHDLL